MKIIFAALLFLLPIVLIAQYSVRDLKKFRINRMTQLSKTGDGSEVHKNEHYYDRHGNDTAWYIGGSLQSRSVFSFDAKGRAVKRIRYNAKGNESDRNL